MIKHRKRKEKNSVNRPPIYYWNHGVKKKSKKKENSSVNVPLFLAGDWLSPSNWFRRRWESIDRPSPYKWINNSGASLPDFFAAGLDGAVDRYRQRDSSAGFRFHAATDFRIVDGGDDRDDFDVFLIAGRRWPVWSGVEKKNNKEKWKMVAGLNGSETHETKKIPKNK